MVCSDINLFVSGNTKLTMKKFITTFLPCFVLTLSFGQTQRKSSMYLQGQYNQTLYDVTKGNNPWGIGLGLQMFFRQTSKFKPTIDLTADAYLEDDKVLRLNTDGTPINDLDGMVNLFAGGSYYPTNTIYLAFVGGSSFIGGQTKFGIKPSLGFYFSQNQKWTGKISYINIFNRDKRTNEDFGSISFSLGVRLY